MRRAALAPTTLPYHNGSMEELRAAVRRALEEAPGSIRELGREAGISHVTLLDVRDGRHGLSPERVRALAGALRRWSDRCAEIADELEEAARGASPEQEEPDG